MVEVNVATLPAPVRAVLMASLGALAALAAVPLWQSLTTAEQPVLWWAGRAFGVLAYAALALSVLFGLAITSKGAGGLLPRKAMMDLHQQWTLSAVVASVLHVATLVFHAESGVTPWAALVPFASARLTGPVALGTVAFLALLVIAVSSWWRTRISFQAWRAVHGLAFGVAVLALVHGWTAGTDTATAAAWWLYVASTAAVLGALVVRVGVAMTPSRK